MFGFNFERSKVILKVANWFLSCLYDFKKSLFCLHD